jgi:hypothetical protein
MDGPSLNNESLENVRWFCRQHPDLIESGTNWANVEEKGDGKMVTIYPWTREICTDVNSSIPRLDTERTTPPTVTP